MFESFGFPAFYMVSQAVLAVYSSGRTSAFALNSGVGVTTGVPVYEGNIDASVSG